MNNNREMPDMGWQFKSKEHGGWLDTRYDNLLDLLHNHYEIRQIAAPAEDVRAEGEEPVAWMQFDGEGNNDFTDDLDTAEEWARNNGPKYADWLTPLYLHPQRPVATLKRFDWDRDGGMVEDSTGEYVRWSDIEEFSK